MNIKKISAAVIAAAVLAVSLTACSDSRESGGNSKPANNSTKNNNTNSVISEIKSALDDDGMTSPPTESTNTEPGSPVITDDPSIVYSPAEDFEYWYDEAAGGTMIRGYTGAGGEVAIPKEIDGKPVTIIDRNTFKDNAAITSIYIPSTVKKIDQCAFQDCKSLETVTLKNGLESIGWNAFNGCEKIKSIEIPDTVTTLEGNTDSDFSDHPGLGIFGSCTSLETA
ncbi:MAG: leucine-rich repeat domain-containing protein, partial [Oscillospiraceae bacterium]|nr:leucine-rich repeat domain-containing protein [Oscillospiraceae bacterium]